MNDTVNTSANGDVIVAPTSGLPNGGVAETSSGLSGFTQTFADFLDGAENLLNTLGQYGVGPAAPQTTGNTANATPKAASPISTGAVVGIGLGLIVLVVVLSRKS